MLSNLDHASSLTRLFSHAPPPPRASSPPLSESTYPANFNQTTRKPGPPNVSYGRQEGTPSSANLPVIGETAVILYIRQPWFLMHSLLGEKLAMPSETGCPFVLILR